MISSAASSILFIGICMVRALCLGSAGFAVDQRLAGLNDVEGNRNHVQPQIAVRR